MILRSFQFSFFFAISLGAFVCVYCVDSSIFENAESVVVSICRLLLFLIVFFEIEPFRVFLAFVESASVVHASVVWFVIVVSCGL